MTTFLSTALTAALLAGGLAYAEDETRRKTQDPQQSGQYGQGQTGTMQRDDQQQGRTDTWTGRVKEYEANKKLELDIRGGIDKSFDLDDPNIQARVDPSVQVGSNVKVTQRELAGGQKMLTVEPAEGAAAAANGRMNGGRRGEASWTGRLKSYEPGKSIEIEREGGRAETFDLGQTQADIAPGLKEGDMVTVKREQRGGGTMITITPHAAANGKPGTTPDSGTTRDKQRDRDRKY